MSTSSVSAEGPLRPKKRHQRQRRKAAAAALTSTEHERHTASQADPVPHIPPKKAPKTETATPPLSSAPSSSSGQSNSSATPFDPKSIIPNTKPTKDLSRLVGASSSGKKPVAFNCIDGTIRSSNPNEPVPSANISILRFDEYVAAPNVQADNNSEERDHYTAFGIKAFPTRAIFNDICHDFVMPGRWCPHSHRCKRIHPLDKRAYLHITKREQRVYENMKATVCSDVAGHEKVDDNHSTAEASDSTSWPRDKRSSGKGSSKDDVQDWDIIWGLESKRGRSSSSSEDGGPSDWFSMPTSGWDSHTDSSSETTKEVKVSSQVRKRRAAAGAKGKEKEVVPGVASADTVNVTTPTHTRSASSAKGKEKEVVPRVASADTVNATPPTHARSASSAKGKGKEVAPHIASVDAARNMPPACVEPLASVKGKEKHTVLGVAAAHPLPPKPKTVQAAPSTAAKAHIRHASTSNPLPPKTLTSPHAVEPAKPVVQGPKLPPRPQNAARCRRWVRGECTLGYDCIHVHEDLEYDDPLPELPSALAPERWLRTIHDHIKVHMGSGFDIEEVTTGSESTFIYVGNLPDNVTDQAIDRLVRPFGEIIQIKHPIKPTSPVVVKVEFSSPFSAYRAWASLHGKAALGCKLDIRMALPNRQNGSLIEDRSVRIDWEYPHRIVFIGFATMELAQEAVERAKHTLYDGLYQTHAEVHIGTPAVGKVTVKFAGVPSDATKEGMYVFGDHQAMMVTRRPNYDMTMEDNVNYIKRLCKQFSNTMTELEFRPGPFKDGKARAWAHFRTAADAAMAARNLNGRKHEMIGNNRLYAKHIKTIAYKIPHTKFAIIGGDIRYLGDKFFEEHHYQSIAIINKDTHTILRVSSEDLELLSKLKVDVERFVNGQLVLTEAGDVAWDDFFATEQAAFFFKCMRGQFKTNMIEVDTRRRAMRIYGDENYMPNVRYAILKQLQEAQEYKWHPIRLDGRLATAFSAGPYEDLQATLGEDKLHANFYKRVLLVRGDEETLAKAAAAVARLRNRLPYDPKVKKALQHECPVCLEEAAPPIVLSCGHAFCQLCLKDYLLASVEQKSFPLSCLGDGGKCTNRIPLRVAQRLLSSDAFDSIVEAAFRVYVQKRATQFHFCPTPNCDQVYRAVPPDLREGRGVPVQCPSCLVRTCAQCHKPEHGGLTCRRADSRVMYDEWADKNEAKRCPGCRMAVEKEWGCNHIHCPQCKTHFCWLCGEISTNEEIYGHMNRKHGTIGLVPTEPVFNETIWWRN